MNWIFVNNDFYEEDKAVLQTGDLALQRGYAAFDFFRTANHQPFFLKDHLFRFYNSAKKMHITVPLGEEELTQRIHQLIERNNIPESGIRLLATGGYSPDSYTPVEGNLIIQQQAITLTSTEKFTRGIRILTYEYQRDLPTVKSTNYLMGIWLQNQLKKKGLDDVLYYTNNIISEFPRANVFMVSHNGTLVTPSRNMLAGVTRKNIIQWSKGVIPVETRDINLNEIHTAAEVFLTSTTKRILPVVEIDGKKIGAGKAGAVSSRLNELFIQKEMAYLSHLL